MAVEGQIRGREIIWGIESPHITSRLAMKESPAWRAGLPSHVASTEASSGRAAGVSGDEKAARLGLLPAQHTKSA